MIPQRIQVNRNARLLTFRFLLRPNFQRDFRVAIKSVFVIREKKKRKKHKKKRKIYHSRNGKMLRFEGSDAVGHFVNLPFFPVDL